MIVKRLVLLLIFILPFVNALEESRHEIEFLDDSISIELEVGDRLNYSMSVDRVEMVIPSVLSFNTSNVTNGKWVIK